MKRESESLNAILRITIRMQEIFPLLSKYITEMPSTRSYGDDLRTNITKLKNYYDSLAILLKRYTADVLPQQLKHVST